MCLCADGCKLSRRCRTSLPFVGGRTLPKATCRPSSQSVLAVVMKNWEPLVFGPMFDIETTPGAAHIKALGLSVRVNRAAKVI